jgi:hypothetical protein
MAEIVLQAHAAGGWDYPALHESRRKWRTYRTGTTKDTSICPKKTPVGDQQKGFDAAGNYVLETADAYQVGH